MTINTVTVVGASGTMGANVAAIFASFGDAKVYCIGRNIEKVRKTFPRIVKSIKADSIEKNLIPADYSMLSDCVRKSDLVFESAPESISVKTDIARQISKALREDAISCTGTSGLSVKEIAQSYPESLRSRFFGVHMFNPPYSMPLCELIPTVYSNEETKEKLKEYLENKLYRTVVEVKDAPAFLGNRIGFQFLNEALRYAEKFKEMGGIDYIDAILGPFTGRAMAPLMTVDFVGLDVHKAIVDNIYENTNDFIHESFGLPDYVQELIEQNRLGRKTNGGLYRLVKDSSGTKHRMVLDINTGLYRDVISYRFPFADQMRKSLAEGDYQKALEIFADDKSLEAEICRYFLLSYIVYAVYTAKEVGFSTGAADDVMATGFNWCPPLAMYRVLSTVADVPALIQETLPDVCEKININDLFGGVESSRYDYRQFFRSGR